MDRIKVMKYYAVLEADTGILVAVLPFTKKNPKEMDEDLKEILLTLCDKHPRYKDMKFHIKCFRRPIHSEEVPFLTSTFPF